MLRALVAAVLIGVVCAVVGSFVILRGMALFGDALAHAILPGIAIAYLIGGAAGPLFGGALAAALITALIIGVITRGGRVREDTAIGVIFSGAFALGVALMNAYFKEEVELEHILFGDISALANADLALIAGFGILVLLALAAFYKELVIVSFDPIHAASLRLPAEALRHLLLGLIAITVVVSVQTIGSALMTAMLVTSAATASLVTRRLSRMILIGSLLGAGSGSVGIYIAYYAGIASGAAIVLVATACFLIVWAATQVWRRR